MIKRLKMGLQAHGKSCALGICSECVLVRQYNVIWRCVVSGLANENKRMWRRSRERERKEWSTYECVYEEENSNRYSSQLYQVLRVSVSFFWAIRSCAAFSFSSTHTLILNCVSFKRNNSRIKLHLWIILSFFSFLKEERTNFKRISYWKTHLTQ